MQIFQQPENALNRAYELQDVNQDNLALQVLHSAIGHKKFRAQGWDSVQEQIMLRYIQLCVDFKRLKLARDGLHQYRSISQQANINSLGKIVCELRDRAEQKVKEIKSLMEKDKVEETKVEDLESFESPEDLILSTLEDEGRNDMSSKLNASLRFLWETYKMILDILRTTPKLERVYHETAHKALLFCKDNIRTQEFKRLCELLRTHYSYLHRHKYKQEYEQLLRADIHIETRMLQLNVATGLHLYKESFNSVEDIYHLGIHDLFMKSSKCSSGGVANVQHGGSSNVGQLTTTVLGVGGVQMASNVDFFYKTKEKLLKWLAIYYDKISMILWASDNHLFHALAYMKYLLHVKNFKRNVNEQELQNMCSTAVLAVLAIPLPMRKRFDSFSPGSLSDSCAIALENNKKMIALLGHSCIPTRDSLKHALIIKDILVHSSPECQKLYGLLEDDFTPLKLCSQCQPLLETFVGTHLEKYVFALKKLVFHKLLLQLSNVYVSVSVEYFTSQICPSDFFPWSDAEKVVVSLVQEGHVQMRLDYAVKAMYFGAATLDPVVMMRHSLSKVGKSLQFCISKMIASEITDAEKMAKDDFVEDIKSRLDEEHLRIKLRNKENNKRRAEKQEEQARAEEEKKKAQELLRQAEETQERQRREDALKKREEQRMKEEKYKVKSQTAQQMLEEIRKIGFNKDKKLSKIIIKGKQLNEINIDDVLEGNVDFEDFEKAQEEQRSKERADRIRQRKLEARRMDHFIRACREEEIAYLDQWKQEILVRDTEIVKNLQAKYEEEHKASFQEGLKEKQMFEIVIPEKNKWVDEKMVVRRREFEDRYAAQCARLLALLKERKILRAKERRDIDIEKQRIEAEISRREEEEKKKLEEIAAKKAEEELKRRKLVEIAERQRQRELEVEEKYLMSTIDYQDTEKVNEKKSEADGTRDFMDREKSSGIGSRFSRHSDDSWRRPEKKPDSRSVEKSGDRPTEKANDDTSWDHQNKFDGNRRFVRDSTSGSSGKFFNRNEGISSRFEKEREGKEGPGDHSRNSSSRISGGDARNSNRTRVFDRDRVDNAREITRNREISRSTVQKGHRDDFNERDIDKINKTTNSARAGEESGNSASINEDESSGRFIHDKGRMPRYNSNATQQAQSRKDDSPQRSSTKITRTNFDHQHEENEKSIERGSISSVKDSEQEMTNNDGDYSGDGFTPVKRKGRI